MGQISHLNQVLVLVYKPVMFLQQSHMRQIRQRPERVLRMQGVYTQYSSAIRLYTVLRTMVAVVSLRLAPKKSENITASHSTLLRPRVSRGISVRR